MRCLSPKSPCSASPSTFEAGCFAAVVERENAAVALQDSVLADGCEVRDPEARKPVVHIVIMRKVRVEAVVDRERDGLPFGIDKVLAPATELAAEMRFLLEERDLGAALRECECADDARQAAADDADVKRALECARMIGIRADKRLPVSTKASLNRATQHPYCSRHPRSFLRSAADVDFGRE